MDAMATLLPLYGVMCLVALVTAAVMSGKGLRMYVQISDA